ncbi:MAG: hypothetical protein BGO98_13950 [Myxococcales bacterium 68-20]|nr:hypothetical protein [Myxococcales bacterium]OJY21074.1 MAG: hypothetical protein BGO98_13950 [Myxococcales bacterium 68-20]
MKPVLFVFLPLFAVACLPGASLDKEKLLSTASFDHGCPKQKIEVVTEDDHGMEATGNYLLKVCGADKRYKRLGTIYYDAEKGSPVPTK